MKKEILAEWNPWWDKKVVFTLIDREFTKNAADWINRKEILGFLGVRRSGKTSLMNLLIAQLMEKTPAKNILFIKCDDERTEKSDLINDAIISYKEFVNPKGKIYLFIDEIQEIENWEQTLKRIYDLEKDVKIFISGSNFSMQKDDFAHKLAGRMAYFEIYPFSFKEFIGAKMGLLDEVSKRAKKNELKHNFLEYAEFGGFPEVALEKKTDIKKQLLQFYFDTIIYRDIIKRREIRDAAKMENLINLLLQNISNPMNFTKTGKDVSLSADTAIEYIKYLQDAYFIFSVPLFSYSAKTHEINPKKIYCVDTGIRNAKGFRFSDDFGRLAENIVFIELKRRISANPLSRIFYWKDKKQNEVDFLVFDKQKVTEAVQMCWNISLPDVKMRETTALVSALQEFDLSEGLVITEDYEAEEIIEKKKIRYVPLWLWLLE